MSFKVSQFSLSLGEGKGGGVHSFLGVFQKCLACLCLFRAAVQPSSFALNLLLHEQDIRRCVIHFLSCTFPAPTISCLDLAFVHVKLIPI